MASFEIPCVLVPGREFDRGKIVFKPRRFERDSHGFCDSAEEFSIIVTSFFGESEEAKEEDGHHDKKPISKFVMKQLCTASIKDNDEKVQKKSLD